MMNDDMKQELSRLMDGDNDAHSEKAIDDLLVSESLRRTWRRYQLIGDALNRNLPPVLDYRLVDRIAADIAREPVSLLSRRINHRYLKPIAGLAIAASVCAIAILSLQKTTDITPVTAPAQVAENQPPRINTPVNSYTFPAATQVVTTQIENTNEFRPNPQFNSYLVNYNEMRSAQAGMQGIIPYVRIIANDDEK